MAQLSKISKFPHFTRLHDAQLVEKEGRADLFLVLDFEKRDLNQFLRHSSEGDFGEQEVMKMLYSMLCALNFLHTAGVMHRDVKPANFLVDPATWRVKLCDMGYARTIPLIYQPASKMASKRRLSQHVVSRWYRPPEVILMEPSYGPSVDVWSVGCVIAEVMTCSTEY